MATRPAIALLDACVLYPPLLRDLFLWLAVEKVFQPKWSDAIHTEWIENLLEQRPTLSRDALLRTRDLMNQHGGDCLVENYEHLIETLTLPDINDRHVLAAAIVAKAETIVTFNLRDFPASVLAQYQITALPPDPFFVPSTRAQKEEYPDRVTTAARQMHQSLKSHRRRARSFSTGYEATA